MKPNKVILNWIKLYNMGNLPIIKQSYIFIIFIPILSGIVNTYNTEFDQHFSNIIVQFSNITVNIDLPFNNFILYISSAFFLLARVMVHIFIPLFIIELKNYKTYKELELDNSDIVKYADLSIYQHKYEKKLGESDKNTYDSYYDYFNKFNMKMRGLISIFFYCGWLGFFFLFIQGGIRVFESI